MFSNSRRSAAVLALALLVALSGQAVGSEFSDASDAVGGGDAAERPNIRIWVNEQRHVVVEDPANGYHLSLPAPYWECSTAAQVAAKMAAQGQGRGCAGRARIPPGLLLVAHNNDAPVQAVLYLMPERFLLRNNDALEGYVKARREQIRPPRGATLEFLEPSYVQEEGWGKHRGAFTMSTGEQSVKGLLVHYFVRPRDEDVRVYRLECMATDDVFDAELDEIEHIVGSFRFRGELSKEFFSLDASDEKLPGAQAPAGQTSACGQGYSGMIFAVVAVLVLYMLVRRRLSRSSI